MISYMSMYPSSRKVSTNLGSGPLTLRKWTMKIRPAPPKWSVQIPLRARAVVLAGKNLFVAGPPDVIDEDDPLGAFEGRGGGLLWAVSTADGKKLAEYPLESPPVFDGLIAAGGRLYLTTTDGRLSCWE